MTQPDSESSPIDDALPTTPNSNAPAPEPLPYARRAQTQLLYARPAQSIDNLKLNHLRDAFALGAVVSIFTAISLFLDGPVILHGLLAIALGMCETGFLAVMLRVIYRHLAPYRITRRHLSLAVVVGIGNNAIIVLLITLITRLVTDQFNGPLVILAMIAIFTSCSAVILLLMARAPRA